MAQTLGENLFKNPGAEEGLIWWNQISTVASSYPPAHGGVLSFNLAFVDQVSYLLQHVDVSKYAEMIDTGNFEALVGGWRYTDFSPNDFWMEIRFLDNLGFEINRWKQENIISAALEWAEIRYQVRFPPQTRTIDIYFRKDLNKQPFLLDDLFLRPILSDSATPTATPVPFSTPTPTPESKPVATPAVTYACNAPTASENHFSIFPPGQAGDFNLGDVFFRPLNIQVGSDRYTDGYGIVVVLDPGEGVTVFGTPHTIESDYAFLRVSAWTTSADVSLALGALDATEADSMAGANLNGSIGLNLLQNASRLRGRFASIEAFYKSERRAIVPVLQAVNPLNAGAATVQFDNLEIYRIPADVFPVPPK